MTERDRNPDILATADRLAEMTGGLEYRRDAIYDALASSSASGAAWRPKVKALTWAKGVYVSTDDNNGPFEGAPQELHAWRAGPYTIIQQGPPDGLFLLRGKIDGVGLAVPTLEAAKAAAQADYEARVLSALEAEQARRIGEAGRLVEDARGELQMLLPAGIAGENVARWLDRALVLLTPGAGKDET